MKSNTYLHHIYVNVRWRRCFARCRRFFLFSTKQSRRKKDFLPHISTRNNVLFLQFSSNWTNWINLLWRQHPIAPLMRLFIFKQCRRVPTDVETDGVHFWKSILSSIYSIYSDTVNSIDTALTRRKRDIQINLDMEAVGSNLWRDNCTLELRLWWMLIKLFRQQLYT